MIAVRRACVRVRFKLVLHSGILAKTILNNYPTSGVRMNNKAFMARSRL